ncbi:MAG: hypothetical protein ABI045_01855 [Flavobacteriales bacterium]
MSLKNEEVIEVIAFAPLFLLRRFVKVVVQKSEDKFGEYSIA